MTPRDRFPEGLRELSPKAQRELLLVLTSPSNVRADVIRQFHERGRGEMVEVLVELEADARSSGRRL